MGWPGDIVETHDPLGFAVDFTRAMRAQRSARWIPSLRTTLAIPRLLAARWMRTRALSPRDYLEAAILCTPVDDRALADQVARALLFPGSDRTTPEARAAAADPTAAILADLASLDLGSLDDLGDLDALLAAEPALDDPTEQGAFALFERWYSSAYPAERGLGELIHRFGGPAELEAAGLRTPMLVKTWIARELLSRVGELDPVEVLHGVRAGFGPELARACTAPWELAGVLAAAGDPRLDPHLDDLLAAGSCHELGRVLAFLGPHPRRAAFADQARSRALELTDFAELVLGLGEWIEPPDDLCEASVRVSPHRALDAGERLERQFGIDLRPGLFERWLRLVPRPDLAVLAQLAVDCDPWAEAVLDAVPRAVAGLTGAAALDHRFADRVETAGKLVLTGLDPGVVAARALATELLVLCPSAEGFLPLLDALLERRAPPSDVPRVLARARALGVPEGEVLDRLGAALDQLAELIRAGETDPERYQRLVQRIRELPDDVATQLCAIAADGGNLAAMAALLAIDLGRAIQGLPAEQAADALGYKGIGGGRNLLRQWFSHRGKVPGGVRARIKELAKAALLDEAFDWMGKGAGSGERGLVPQSEVRPFRAGDDLDGLDLESTLEAVVSSGRPLDQLGDEDLFAHQRAEGRAALCVLVDISGSMSGGELAVCAIAILMLLGRLAPEEVALAAFESDTHAIKRFGDDVDLDGVADQVLELAATGGTRVEAALRFAEAELGLVPEADLRVVMILSDFQFFEGADALRTRCDELAALGARLLATSHGAVAREVLTAMLERMGGVHLSLDDLEGLPALLLAALADLRA